MIGELLIVDCMVVSPWVVVWTRAVWIRHRFMVVRGFCFVKYGAPGGIGDC